MCSSAQILKKYDQSPLTEGLLRNKRSKKSLLKRLAQGKIEDSVNVSKN